MEFAPGIRVSARGLTWDVVTAEPAGAQSRLRLRCVAGDLAGLGWDFLHPNEAVTPLDDALRPEAPGPLQLWRLRHIAALLQQVSGETLLAAQPGRLRLEPYQLVPLLRALELPRPRLLLADAVGLGKTIEAGLIVTELIARRRAHRVLVVAPAGPLLRQWEQELRHRFGLRCSVIADAAALRHARRALPRGSNPFDSIALCLTSLDFAKQEIVLQELARSSWDLAIIDEAHHCIGAGPGADREDTERRRLAELIARRSDGLLLLTATPHDGYEPHFVSLIELLDPSLVDGRGNLSGRAYRRHVVRRLKSHLRDPHSGQRMFGVRQVVPVAITMASADASVRQFHQALAALIAPRLQRRAAAAQPADALAFVGLLKRSVSTIAACVATLRRVAQRYAAVVNDGVAVKRQRARAMRGYRRRMARYGVLDAMSEAGLAALEVDDIAADLRRCGTGDMTAVTGITHDETANPPGSGADVVATADAATDGPTDGTCAANANAAATETTTARMAIPDVAGTDATSQALAALIKLGEHAARHDPKLLATLGEIRLIRAAEPRANVLVYTEYADSQAAAVQALRDASAITGTVLAISGRDPEHVRIHAAECCAVEDDIILVSTDALAEGLNLQRRCWHLIHLDLPYNPNRLEQRNGRIDRYGQRHDPQIRYLYLAGTFEEWLLLRLIAKYEQARAQLDFMPDTLGVPVLAAATDGGIGGFAEAQVPLFERAAGRLVTLEKTAEAVNAAAYRELLREIDTAFAGHDRLAARHGWLREQGVNAGYAQVVAADAMCRASDGRLGGIDLAGFVRDTLAFDAATGVDADRGPDPDAAVMRAAGAPCEALPLPPDWAHAAADLPGFDAAGRCLRFTRDPARWADANGSLGFIGRAHPLVQRAIDRLQRAAWTIGGRPVDGRVAVASAGCGESAAVLLTWLAELRNGGRLEWQTVVAVLLPQAAPAVLHDDPLAWLCWSAPGHASPGQGGPDWAAPARATPGRAVRDRALPGDAAWQRWFADWVPARQAEAEALAIATMQSRAGEIARTLRDAGQRQKVELATWLGARANEICGAALPQSVDLFGAPSAAALWRMPIAPHDRLAAFAVDGSNPPARRREADAVLEAHRNAMRQGEAGDLLGPPELRPLGMLMLVPRDASR